MVYYHCFISIFINMQPIDPHNLFSIFEQGDEQIYKEHQLDDVLQNPFVLMGMVLRGIENYNLMDVIYKRQYPKEYIKVREVTKLKYFNKLFSYLQRIDLNNREQIYTIGESFDRESILSGLDVLRVYYERLEHYEKCAVIKKYVGLVESQPESRLI